MSKRIVIDPVTRIEGHLRVEVEVAEGTVINAWTKGTMFRGIEQILKGRDPRDAVYITERVCGVCMTSHGWTSAMAVENAHGVVLPPAARLIRNLLAGALWLHDHPLHFYHLSALDYLDVLAVKHYQGNDQGLLGVRDKIMKLVEMGDTAPLTPRYQPDGFSVRDPEIVISALAHYLEALTIQGKAKKMSAILGGKQPHQSSIVVGGVTLYPSEAQLAQFSELLDEVVSFISNVYVPDVTAFATGPLLKLAQAGVGASSGNYLAYGAFPNDDYGNEKLFRAGFVSSDQPGVVQDLDYTQITEAVTNSWYKDSAPSHPWEGMTEIDMDKAAGYSFVKAPRYQGKVTEVGPLARMLVRQHKPLLNIMEAYKIKPGAVARHLARAQETLLVAEAMYQWLEELNGLLGRGRENSRLRPDIHDGRHWQPPSSGRGFALNEAPRGALGHWVVIENHMIKNYQMVVPTTWNASPRDELGALGPIEHALIDLPVDPENPVNIVRVIRSFDPCLACAVHLIGLEGNKVVQI